MQSFARVSAMALIVLVCAFPVAAASNAGSSANGSFQFSHDGLSRTVDFNVRQHTNSNDVSGEMTFNGQANLPSEDVDGDGNAGPGDATTVNLTVSFDCLKLNGNKAAASGLVTSSSVSAYVGKRVLLAVEDNGEPNNVDRVAWGVYGLNDPSWTPEDAEVPGDPGWGLGWDASDFENPDDVPVPFSRSTNVDCKSFGLANYDLIDLAKGAGNIQVKP